MTLPVDPKNSIPPLGGKGPLPPIETNDGVYNKDQHPNPLNLPRESVPPVYLMLGIDRDRLLKRD